MSHADQFATRAHAALSEQFPEIGTLRTLHVLQCLAGSWLAFDAALAQQSKHLLGSPLKSNGIPPVVEDVAAYLVEISYPIDPQGFVDFYQQKGWKIGRGNTPMKDWRSACRQWKRNLWGHRLDGVNVGMQRQQNASLGALQIQLDRIREQLRAIINPGGAAWPKTASQLTSGELARVHELEEQRDGLKKRIEGFSQ